MAEPRKGTCTRCPRTDVSINADETLRLHAANGKRVNEDNPRCPGSGQPPAGAQGLPETVTGYVCRVPAGPDGCGRPVQLTANSRARSHLNSAGHPCGGGSDWPLRVNERGERTDMAPQGEVYPAVGPDGLLIDGRTSMAMEFDPQDPDGPGEAPTDPGSAFITELKGAVGDPGTVASQLGTYAEGLFDVTHVLSDPETQTYGVHPGEATDCRLPGCCTHPRGFDYGDDGKGQSGSFCFLCGAPEPTPCVHEYGGHDVWDDQNGTEAQVSACLHCGEVEPEPTPEELKARSACIVGQLDTGVMFTRASFPGLVFRVEAVTEFAVQATVVSAGSHHGRTGELTNLQEEITCTDVNGQPRPRRDVPAPGTSALEAVLTNLGGRPDGSNPRPPQPTPSTPRTTPNRSSVPSSAPGTTATAPNPSASSGAASARATTSGRTVRAATSTRSAVTDAFSTPKQATKESDKYDSYGRYKLLHPKTGKKVNWTRATTFAKSIQDTYALSMWSQRMVLKGAALRSDLTAAASTLEVKADKDRMNTLVEDAKSAAGNKIAANKGTAVHAYTEDRDRILVGMETDPREIPEEFIPTVDAYEATLKAFGLEPVPGLIEFTTAVLQYEVAGTSDRVYRVTRDMTFKLNGRPITLYAGEYVIGDVKTGADLGYGWQEIAIQLALYAQGLNTVGVWDWGTRGWAYPSFLDGGGQEVRIQVRTDVGIIPHLPVDRSTTKAPLATLYAVDLDAGWAATVLCGQVRGWRKERTLATPLEIADVADSGPQAPVSRPVPESRPVTLEDRAKAVTSKAEASAVFQEAVGAKVPRERLDRLVSTMSDKLKSITEPGG